MVTEVGPDEANEDRDAVLPEGDDLTQLMRPTGISTLVFDYKGSTWKFTYRQPDWTQQMDALSQALMYDEDGNAHLDYSKYYLEMLIVMITKGPKGWKNTPTVIRPLDPEVFGKLMSIVPKPQIMAQADDAKKE